MKKLCHRVLSAALSAAMLFSLATTASALDWTEYPDEYWTLSSEWSEVYNAQDHEGILEVAEKIYRLMKDIPLDEEVAKGKLQSFYARASRSAECIGNAKLALTWLEREMEVVNWIYENTGDYRDLILNGEARARYLSAAANPTIYVQTDEPTSYGNAPALGTWYGSDAGGSQTGESAVLFYVNFMDGYSMEHWLGYYNNNHEKFSNAIHSTNGVIELAWNISPESTEGIRRTMTEEGQAYIKESLAALGALEGTILLRFGGEMNNWSDCDAQTYIEAFRAVAKEAHKYSNIQMVFSPDNVSNRNVSFEEFYPGDEYVDWVGVSTYHISNYYSYPKTGEATRQVKGGFDFNDTYYLNDAYYGNGTYDSDPLIIFAPIAEFAEEHGKPMMISECGFAQLYGTEDQTDYAVDQITKLYAYANMIYPNLKAVFYFDVNTETAGSHYAFESNPKVYAAYRSAIESNGGYLDQGETEGKNWIPFDESDHFYKNGETITLATYASFPGSDSTTVKYYVDGKLYATATTEPFTLTLDTSELFSGGHTLQVEATSGQFTSTSSSIIFTVCPDGVTGLFKDLYDPFYDTYVEWAVGHGVVYGNDDGSFTPDRLCSMEEIITMLWRAAGKPEAKSSAPIYGDWAQSAVDWAYEAGYITADSFTFGAPCTRADVVLFLWTAAGKPQASTKTTFTDVPADAAYATAVAWALEQNITNGTSATTFTPDYTCTRYQIVTFLYRYFAK